MAYSNLEKALLAYIGVSSATTRKIAIEAVKGLARVSIRAAPAVARGGLGLGAGLAAANPVLTGGALGLGALQTDFVQDQLRQAEERGRMDRIRYEQLLTDLSEGAKKKTRKAKSSYNKAVSASMSAVRASKFQGKKGSLSNPQKTFGNVSKIVSKVLQGKKVARSGVTGVIKKASTPILDSRKLRLKAIALRGR